MNVIITALALPILFLVRNKPPTVPSKSAAQRSSAAKVKLLPALKKLFKNTNFMFLLISFSFLYGVYMTLGAVVALITHEFGYKATDNSIFGVVFLGSGLLGSFTHAIILDKFKRFKM
jgi:fucose permease